jgi:hypothetical protein
MTAMKRTFYDVVMIGRSGTLSISAKIKESVLFDIIGDIEEYLKSCPMDEELLR